MSSSQRNVELNWTGDVMGRCEGPRREERMGLAAVDAGVTEMLFAIAVEALQARDDFARTDERGRVDDAGVLTTAETDAEAAAETLALGRFRAILEVDMAGEVFFSAEEEDLAPWKCVLTSFGARSDFALRAFFFSVAVTGGVYVASAARLAWLIFAAMMSNPS